MEKFRHAADALAPDGITLMVEPINGRNMRGDLDVSRTPAPGFAQDSDPDSAARQHGRGFVR